MNQASQQAKNLIKGQPIIQGKTMRFESDEGIEIFEVKDEKPSGIPQNYEAIFDG